MGLFFTVHDAGLVAVGELVAACELESLARVSFGLEVCAHPP